MELSYSPTSNILQSDHILISRYKRRKCTVLWEKMNREARNNPTSVWGKWFRIKKPWAHHGQRKFLQELVLGKLGSESETWPQLSTDTKTQIENGKLRPMAEGGQEGSQLLAIGGGLGSSGHRMEPEQVKVNSSREKAQERVASRERQNREEVTSGAGSLRMLKTQEKVRDQKSSRTLVRWH